MELEERIQLIEDKMALRQLVDTYAILMDEKNGAALKNLFAPGGQLKNFIGNEEKLTLSSPEEIANTYQSYLPTVDTIFHMSGQQVLNVRGERALGRSYFQATITETRNGTKVTTCQNIYFDDEFCKVAGQWLFAKRHCHYVNISTK